MLPQEYPLEAFPNASWVLNAKTAQEQNVQPKWSKSLAILHTLLQHLAFVFATFCLLHK